MEFVAKVMARVKLVAKANQGYKVIEHPPVLGHFFSKFEPL